MDCARAVSLKWHHNRPQHRTKLKSIDGFSDANWVNSGNFIATILRFSKKFDPSFLHVFLFGNMFPESHGFAAAPITSSNKFVSLHLLDRDKLKHVSLIQLATGIETKPWLSGNMSPNIKTCRNGWSNLSENLREVALKLLELIQFAWPNLSTNFNFVRCRGQ